MRDKLCEVLFLIPTLHGGGAERVVTTLLRQMDRTRFRPALAVVDLREAAFLDEVPEDVEVIDLGHARVLSAMPQILRMIRTRRPDVVLSTLPHLNLALAALRWLLPDGIKYIARETCMVSDMIRSYPRPALWRLAYHRLYNRFDTVICPSDAMRDDLVHNFGLQRERAVVIFNPVDVDRIRRLAAMPAATDLECAVDHGAASRVHLLAVGRLVPEKGFDMLIEALAQSNDARLHVTLLGDGPLRHELEALALRLGVAERVRLAGFQKNPYPYFAQADAFILSSRSEGFPNVVLEALVCGTPVIALPAPGGVQELLRGVDGCVVAKEISAAALATLIRRVSRGTRLPTGLAATYSAHEVTRQYERQMTAARGATERSP